MDESGLNCHPFHLNFEAILGAFPVSQAAGPNLPRMHPYHNNKKNMDPRLICRKIPLKKFPPQIDLAQSGENAIFAV